MVPVDSFACAQNHKGDAGLFSGTLDMMDLIMTVFQYGLLQLVKTIPVQMR